MFRFTTILLLFLAIMPLTLNAQSGEIQGKVKDTTTGEGIPFIEIRTKVGNTLRGAQSDFDGFYSIKPLPIDTVPVTFSHPDYTTMRIQQVPIEMDKITFLDTHLVPSKEDSVNTRTKAYKNPLVYRDICPAGSTVTKEEIDKIATRSALLKTAIRSTGKTYKQEDINRLPIR